MDLALLVYGISLLTAFGSFITFVASMCILITIISTFIYVYHTLERPSDYDYKYGGIDKKVLDKQWSERKEWSKTIIKIFAPLFFVVAIIGILLPSEKTAYVMVGAYTAQKVAENPEVQKLSGKVLTIIENKLDSYIDEAEKKMKEKSK